MIPAALRFRLCAEPRRGVFVAFVQSVIRAGHKHLAPLDEAGGEKPSDHANDDFLDEGGVHYPSKESRSGARAVTNIPVTGRPIYQERRQP